MERDDVDGHQQLAFSFVYPDGWILRRIRRHMYMDSWAERIVITSVLSTIHMFVMETVSW